MTYRVLNSVSYNGVYQSGSVESVRNYLPTPYYSGSNVFGGIDEYFLKLNNPPDVWTCAYCGSLQSDVRDVIIRSYKLNQRVYKCLYCLAPRTY